MSEKISIIIPVYKVEQYLDRCIKSVVNQTYRNLEIILVNDGSTDDSPKICDCWARKDNRIKVIHKENGGLSDARNAGINIATGEFISFLDSDDIIAPIMIEFLYDVLLNRDADIAVTTMKVFDEVLPTFIEESELICGTSDEILYEIICKSAHWEACGKLYKKSLFNNNLRFIKNKLYEDLHFTPRIFAKAKKAIYCDNQLYGYFQRNDSIMGETKNIISENLIEVLRLNIDFIKHQYSIDSDIYQQLFCTFILHPSIKLEDIELQKTYTNNVKFIKEYKKYIRNNWREIKLSGHISKKYKLGLFVSMYSVVIYNKIFKIFRVLQSKEIIEWRRK